MSKVIKMVLPINGKVLPLSDVNDYLFSKKVMGEGAAIEPIDGNVVSPIDGKIVLIYKTNHAIAVENKDGIKVLIHVGLDSAKLEGRGFALYVKVGDEVKAGDKILSFDRALLEKNASIITPVVITDSEKVTNYDIDYSVNKAGKEFAQFFID